MRTEPLYPEELAELIQTAKVSVSKALELWATDEHDRVYRELAARALRQYAQVNYKMAQLCEDGEGEEAEDFFGRGLEASTLAEAITEGRVNPPTALEFGRQRRSVEASRLHRSLFFTVRDEGRGVYTVFGEGRAHHTTPERCDCPDFRYGYLCKHLLAVRRHLGKRLEPGQTLLVELCAHPED